MKKKFLTSILLSTVLTFGALTGCAGSSAGDAAGTAESTETATEAESTEEATEAESTEEATEAESTEESADVTAAPADGDNKIVVGATPVPHAEILDNILKDVLAKDGWELETVVFNDYVLPNTSLEEGELDANYFQTLGYMNQQNEDAGLHLAAVAGVHIEPMGIYSEKYTALADIPDGGSIGIPNDPDNGERAIDLLVQKGLLTSKGGFGTDDNYTEDALTKDAEANPHGYVITPLEAASLPLSLPDLDAAAINGNYALEAGLPDSHPALDIEEFDDETTVKRTNFLVVKQGNEDSAKIQALVKALQSDEVKAYIDETYKGAVISSFIDGQ
ncbi:MetQ/NlpA family ABC transporter substrate-binding protein [Butyrivibrio sp. WCD2001]|uniref:MetQ/NlpA family ABC transporter substrate-binding protein n=1 Tax=Butyrivibrio sp. WCD2001 TaxID=1280681 RepID=UPI000422CA11|nr:MetQ/NlpA family ABC transporter substrate-binding protein [Butyrivibrio sp. WCD2001]